jgi:hypothetical protein
VASFNILTNILSIGMYVIIIYPKKYRFGKGELGPLAQPITLPILSRFEEFTISMTIMTFEAVRRFSGLKIKLHSSQRIAVGCFEQPHLMSTVTLA